MQLEIYQGLIYEWSKERGIIQNGKPMAQAIKTLEETTELLDAMNQNDRDEVKDAIGDIFVTLCNVCFTYGVELNDCVDGAWNEIKDRKGYLRADGTFVKD